MDSKNTEELTWVEMLLIPLFIAALCAGFYLPVWAAKIYGYFHIFTFDTGNSREHDYYDSFMFLGGIGILLSAALISVSEMKTLMPKLKYLLHISVILLPLSFGSCATGCAFGSDPDRVDMPSESGGRL